MSLEEDSEILRQLREAIAKRRGYADHFSWPLDRDREELGIVQSLHESLNAKNRSFFTNLTSRGRGKDPPDCEAQDRDGKRIGIEVTELVDPDAIRAFKRDPFFDFADWTKESFLSAVRRLLEQKDAKFRSLKGAPYSGGYIVVIHTDETMLSTDIVAAHLDSQVFGGLKHIARAFLLVSYDPAPDWRCCPHFELALTK